jgi:hypothetical protein
LGNTAGHGSDFDAKTQRRKGLFETKGMQCIQKWIVRVTGILIAEIYGYINDKGSIKEP